MVQQRRVEADADTGHDPLGKPLATYTTGRSAVLVIVLAVILGLGGGAVLGAADQISTAVVGSRDEGLYAVAGWVLMLGGAGTMAWGVLLLGRRLEVRRKGVRYVRRRRVQELRWDEIADIRVRKITIYYRGAKQGVRWEVDFDAGARSIYLDSTFLRHIPRVTELVQLLETASGKRVELPPLV